MPLIKVHIVDVNKPSVNLQRAHNQTEVNSLTSQELFVYSKMMKLDRMLCYKQQQNTDSSFLFS
jgi:hypothetical protein